MQQNNIYLFRVKRFITYIYVSFTQYLTLFILIFLCNNIKGNIPSLFAYRSWGFRSIGNDNFNFKSRRFFDLSKGFDPAIYNQDKILSQTSLISRRKGNSIKAGPLCNSRNIMLRKKPILDKSRVRKELTF